MISHSLPLRPLIRRLGWLALCLSLPCCGPQGDVEITGKQLLPESGQQPRTGASSEERFRVALEMFGFRRPSGEASTAQPKLVWDTPPGWKAVHDSSMRQLDFRFGKDAEGECYLMSAGGSLVSNVNRWRQQMGLPPIEEEEVLKLPKRPLAGMDAFQVSIDGDYAGMGGSETKKGYRLLGVIVPKSDVSVFVKMVGPKSTVMENEASFQAFCDSLRIENP